MNDKLCSAAATTISVVYDKNVHGVASCQPLNTNIPLGTCDASARTELNPVDLVAMGLASCLLILMGKTAAAERLDMVGATATARYEMENYRLTAFHVDIHLPKNLAANEQAMLEAASKTCPVHLAIHPDVRVAVTFHWPK